MSEGAHCPEIFYVSQKKLDVVKHMLKKGREVGAALLRELIEPPADASDKELMVPVDMTGFGDHEFESVETALAKLGAKKTAESFVRSQEYFEKFISNLPEDFDKESLPQPMTMKEWREAQEDDEDESVAEDAEAAGSASASAAADAEPAAKKARAE
eukprot:TRINITY_DN13683_c0_g1_i1.p1 TRINITY_DN13683_c0_g1~~TRINITY_DN13683_c0_g1_i1.p1  ORF type:complete len:171 (+),score=55.87 TRINITY_DN13683_c0_g1_i1:44-514(+)